MSEQSDVFYKEKIEKINKLDVEQHKREQRWIALRDSYKHCPKAFAPIQKGLIFTKKLCPVCGRELHKVVVVESYDTYLHHSGLFQGTTIHIEQRELYTCEKCGYEYAYEEGDSFN